MTTENEQPPDPLIAQIMSRLRAGEYQHDIAADLGVNQGRISEIKNGKRSRIERRKRPDRPDQPKFI